MPPGILCVTFGVVLSHTALFSPLCMTTHARNVRVLGSK